LFENPIISDGGLPNPQQIGMTTQVTSYRGGIGAAASGAKTVTVRYYSNITCKQETICLMVVQGSAIVMAYCEFVMYNNIISISLFVLLDGDSERY